MLRFGLLVLDSALGFTARRFAVLIDCSGVCVGMGLFGLVTVGFDV